MLDKEAQKKFISLLKEDKHINDRAKAIGDELARLVPVGESVCYSGK